MKLTTATTTLALTAAAALALGGCQTMPAAPANFLDGTRWAVTDVNGVSVANRDDFTVSFTGSRFEGRFGCRTVSGTYTLRGAITEPSQPIFQGGDGRFSGEPCVGNLPEEIGPDILVNATFSVAQPNQGTMVFLQPPTGMAFRRLP